MIKRFIACLTICLIITGLISPVFSHAEPIPIYTPNWNDPGIAEIINISDLTGWMANGGVYDITSFQNLDEFLSLYFKVRVPIEDQDGNITFAPYYGYEYSLESGSFSNLRFNEQSQIRGMIGRSYQNKTGYGRRLQEQVDKALLNDGDLSNINIPLLNASEAAFFVGYNPNAINQYKGSFSLNNPEVNPDSAFLSYITTINSRVIQQTSLGTSFFWATNMYPYNWQISVNGVLEPYTSDFPIRFSWVVSDLLNAQISSYTTNRYSTNLIVGYDIFDIYINYDQNGIYNLTSSSLNQNLSIVRPIYGGTNTNSFYLDLTNPNQATFPNTSTNSNYPTSINYSGTLTDCFDWLSRKVKNVNIYVDGIPWSLVSEPSEPEIIPEFPDVVGGEDLPATTWPLTVPKAPSYINIPGLRQAFQRAKNTDNQFDIMDLTDSLVDPDGDPIVDPEMETIPIPLPNPDPINPEVVPELPDLPLIPTADNPGFSGVSVLAEIINFTNQSLPSALITVFWGIVFGAVILGIIKILHK